MSENRPRNTNTPRQPNNPPTSSPSPVQRTNASRQSGTSWTVTRKPSRWAQARAFARERPWIERGYGWASRLFLYGFLFSIGWVVVLKWVPVWITPLTVSRWWDTVGTDQSSRVHKDWVAYDNLSKEAALAVLSSEDQAFPNHWGFDFDEIQDAIKENKYRKRPRGASTISQQVAKNVFLWNGRSYIRKGLEVYFTALIELVWGKKRILEVYLNVAETGPMTFGVEAASQRFYGHPAKSLSRDEAARIAAVLPNPRQFSIKNPSNYVQRRTRQIARQMRALGGQKYVKNL